MKRNIRYVSLTVFWMIFVASSLFGTNKTIPVDSLSIKKVHLIFKTHLDIGFTNLGEKVLDIYMKEFIPKALSLSENLRKKGSKDRYIWTTGSWLITEFLEKSDPIMRKRMEQAIKNGDIVWHGLPFTTHSELADPSLFDLGIQLSKQLDKRFGTKTIAAKLTDVPGHTRSIVPILAKNGIIFLHIGVNSASTRPDVPPLFIWRAPDGSEVVVMYQQGYGNQLVLPGTHTLVDIRFTSDNHGPHTPEQISQIYSELHKKYPNAEITASTLNDVAREVMKIRKNLPVVTRELGDTWIHGIVSDPLKIAKFRDLSRLRLKWLKEKKIVFGDSTDLAFGIPLLMVAEHTWGLDVKKFLKDWNIYSPEDFKAARTKPNFQLMEQSWKEKRSYIDKAINNLPASMASEANKTIHNLVPTPADKTNFIPIVDLNKTIDTRYYELKVSSTNGSIIKLRDKTTGKEWANEQQPLALFSYQTFSANDYNRFHNQYLILKTQWALDDFGKPGLENTNAESKTWQPTLKGAYRKTDSNGESILIELVIVNKNGTSVGGCPANISVELFFPTTKKEMQIALKWFNKPAYRLPEASWFSFIPAVEKGNWMINKMGQEVNFRDVVKNGNRSMHANFDGVRLAGNTNNCSITSLDAPLVAFGVRTLLNFDNRLPEVNEGMHFCLHNNVWGTNFMMWFDDDMQYRFVFKS